MMKHTKIPRKWRNVHSLKCIKAKLRRAEAASVDGASVTIEIGFFLTLIDVIDQALHTEIGHGPS